jgi:single-strand DNA-binding protein
MQTITIAGRIGKDAELRSTNNGDQVCGFSVAVDSRQGREKVTNWWRVSLWGKRAEALSQYLTKGSNVAVSGEFSLGNFDGKPQLNIRANEITLQGGNTGGSDQRREPDGSRGGPANGPSNPGSYADDLDDNIPFASNGGIW